MRKSKFTECQIAGILKKTEASVPVTEMARKHAISPVPSLMIRGGRGITLPG